MLVVVVVVVGRRGGGGRLGGGDGVRKAARIALESPAVAVAICSSHLVAAL